MITLCKSRQHLWSQWQHYHSNSSEEPCWLLHCWKTIYYVPLRCFELPPLPKLTAPTPLPSSFFASFLLPFPSKLSYNFFFFFSILFNRKTKQTKNTQKETNPNKNPCCIISWMSNFPGMLHKQSFGDESSNQLLEAGVSTSSCFNSFSSAQSGKQSHMETRKKKV